jgi:acetylornithine deacetylase/succinyl-diaminopimelate desuccinylase-like protein
MPAGHGGVHQPDECISVEGLLNAIELTTLILLECDKEINK